VKSPAFHAWRSPRSLTSQSGRISLVTARKSCQYTQIVTIATDDHHTLQEFRASVGAAWTFLSDPDRIVQKDLDIQEYTDPEHNPMIPHTLVLKPGLVIYGIYNGYWFWGRPSIVDLSCSPRSGWAASASATSQLKDAECARHLLRNCN